MVRLYLFAEGQTEQTFASTILQPYLTQYQVFMHHPRLIAHGRKKGKTNRGGSGYGDYQPMKNDILRSLAEDKNTDVFFTTMIDLYAIHHNFPGLKESEIMRQNPTKRVEFLEKSFADDIDDPRFIPYIQLHEYEAYLFSDPTCFESFYDNCSDQVAILKTIADSYETPELINDSRETAPSKRIIAQFPDYEKAKSTYGPLLAESIGLEIIRNKCPHCNSWLLRLELLSGGVHSL
ncbi:DUF4276 family protein [Dolichospermum circinale CS-537/01]|uniref:DUF4276 family protein n=1 Tax=Dolichospermum circinale CS-537/01 TaxID=3021739 RepID=A0ABT5A493_9CYAN|nr:DUF4276 family protein [Dolichospermum circinale]MDB9486752.1 DUF4276 family protein [Dolichospermum circinale CS-537/01]